MLKNRIWLGIILSIILLIFSTNGFAISYYKFTQESGDLFYVADPDKADALEDTNELRQIVSDLGGLLVHSKKNDTYPKDATTGGTLSIPNSALVSFATGIKGDLFYCSATNTWTKLNRGTDNQIFVVATDLPNWETATSDLLSDVAFIAMLDEAKTITANWVNTAFPWADNEVADNITCSSYYLKTEIDTIGEVETIWGKNITDSDELAAALTLYYLKTAIDTQGEVEAIWGVALVNDGDLDLYYLKTAIDTQGEVEAIWGVALVNDGDLDLYYLKTAIDSQAEMETIWGVSLANDSELHNILTLGTANGLSLDGQILSLAVNSDTSAGVVTSGAGQVSKVWKTNVDGVPGWGFDEGGVGATAFLALSDTPTNYTGSANKFLQVNATPDALIFDTISSADLSDAAYIAMLDEAETITGTWSFNNYLFVRRINDDPAVYPYITLEKRRDGDPTANVSDGDQLGVIDFNGLSTVPYTGARVTAFVDGTPGFQDMPGRLEFRTTPDASYIPVLRMAIDNAGNIKMGDGAWTNYVKVTAGGAMTAEGTASIKATDLVIASQAAGDILYFNGTNWIRLAIGTAGQILTVNAGGTAPEWQTP